jgi:transposase-like protein
MAKKLRKYTAEFRQEAVKLAFNSPSISATAKELGVPESISRDQPWWIHSLMY